MKLRVLRGARAFFWGRENAIAWVAGVTGVIVFVLCISDAALRWPHAPVSFTTIEAVGQSAEMQGRMYRPLWAALAEYFAGRSR